MTAFRSLTSRDTYTDNMCVHTSMPLFDLMMPLNKCGEPQLPELGLGCRVRMSECIMG